LLGCRFGSFGPFSVVVLQIKGSKFEKYRIGIELGIQ